MFIGIPLHCHSVPQFFSFVASRYEGIRIIPTVVTLNERFQLFFQ